MQNFRPGVMTRLGLDWEQARAINPRLIYVSASGYGETNPYPRPPRAGPPHQAISGIASISGRADEAPTAVGTAVIDQHGASLLAMGVLAALLERERTGQGCTSRSSMLRAALDLEMEVATYVLNGARPRAAATPLASMFHPPPYGLYATSDDYRALSMSPLSALRDALDLPALEPYTRERGRSRRARSVARLLVPVIKTRTTAGCGTTSCPSASGRRRC